MNSKEVISPKSRIRNVEVLYDNSEFSIASLLWNKQKRIAIRWNGYNSALGYPQSHGYPTWFIIPKEIALAYAQNIGNSTMESIVRSSSDEPFV